MLRLFNQAGQYTGMRLCVENGKFFVKEDTGLLITVHMNAKDIAEWLRLSGLHLLP